MCSWVVPQERNSWIRSLGPSIGRLAHLSLLLWEGGEILYWQTNPWGWGGRGAVGGRGRKSLGFSLTWNVNKWSREIDLHPSGAMYLLPLPSKAYFLFIFLLYYFFLLRCSCCAPRHLFYPVILESIRPVLFAVNTWIVQKYENVPGELCLNTCHSFYYLRFEYEWKTKDYQECY